MDRTLSKLAMPFVVTIALTSGCKQPEAKGGCEPPDCHANPPPQEPPPVNVDPVPTASSSAPPTTPEPVPTASPSASAEAGLPEAPPGAIVQHDAEGCFYMPEAKCPPYDPKRPISCNPPAAQRVKCPKDAPDTP
jgi:hypothetical protein